MTPTQITLAAVAAVLGVVGAIYHRSPLPIARSVGDPIVELIRWSLLVCTAIMLIGEMAAPRWLSWAHLPFPDWARIVGGFVAVAASVLITWAFVALGPNFAATLIVRQRHELVTHGPYRRVRHPMYTLGFLLLVGLGVLSGNWVVLTTGPTAMAVIMVARVPKEEKMLAEEFGEEWRTYASRTGRLVPRILRN